MATYDLSHLIQTRIELGPIHDDEALILYAICRSTGIDRVLELGGLGGYSARNFLAAGCEVTTVEINGKLPEQTDRHRTIYEDCGKVADLVEGPFGMVFFDAHDYRAETRAFDTLILAGCITADTVIAVHDTGFHREWLIDSEHTEHGWLHNPAARSLRDYLVARGCTELFLPTLHGLSLLQWTS